VSQNSQETSEHQKKKTPANPYLKKKSATEQQDEFFDAIDDEALLEALDSTEQKNKKQPDGFAGIDDKALLEAAEAMEKKRLGSMKASIKNTPTPNDAQNKRKAPTEDLFVGIDDKALLDAVEATEKQRIVTPSPKKKAVCENPYDKKPAATARKALYKSPQSSTQQVRSGEPTQDSVDSSFQPCSLSVKYPEDDVSALTTDDLVDPQDDETANKDPSKESPEVKAMKQRLVSMAGALEKVLKRKYPHQTKYNDSLSQCIDRLVKKNVLPIELGKAMHEIRWLGCLAQHSQYGYRLPEDKEVFAIIQNYQRLRKIHSNLV
jgi:hypothetical protein